MSLCIDCAMCCDGTLFGHLTLAEGEAREFGSKVSTYVEDGQTRVRLGCPHLAGNGACGIYGQRPGVCRGYRCRLLKRVDRGDMDEARAASIVQRAKELRQQSRDRYIAATPSVHRPNGETTLTGARNAFKRARRAGEIQDRYAAVDAVLEHEHFVGYIRAHFRGGFRKGRSSD